MTTGVMVIVAGVKHEKRIIKTVDVIFAKIGMAVEVLKSLSVIRTLLKFVIQKKILQSIEEYFQ